ncbi:MAG: Protein translocase subunit SecF [Candidatus Daviesbacteria bacterium GW2011_GWA2_42_7]|uniref:Protein translocase subunit SecF n=1 Tax=Candidatus Daviesbacteria bacterium GW2011_GWA2_42_7 TaxID=1618425 RepID=A0A0G1B6S9_9BACT|nr:MAG: Protein translocase subunit SecF [Candidatus Daviesbacteria bacterium GW2011_GWA2_42_7]
MIDLMGKKWRFFILSGIIILPGIISLGLYGLNLGVDFTGGALLEYKFENKLDKEDIRREFISSGIEVSGIVETGEASYIVKTKPINEQKIIEVKKSLSEKFGQVEELRVENVGPTIGVETTRNAFVSLGLASAMIVIYLALAFRKVPKPTSPWRFGVTAVIALLHDVLLLVGLFSLLGHFLKVEVDVLFVTAALTVVGFSVHDTIHVSHGSLCFTGLASIRW